MFFKFYLFMGEGCSVILVDSKWVEVACSVLCCILSEGYLQEAVGLFLARVIG